MIARKTGDPAYAASKSTGGSRTKPFCSLYLSLPTLNHGRVSSSGLGAQDFEVKSLAFVPLMTAWRLAIRTETLYVPVQELRTGFRFRV